MGRLLNHYPKNIGKFYLLIIRKINHRKRPQIITKKLPKILFTYLHPIFTEGITGEGIKADT